MTKEVIYCNGSKAGPDTKPVELPEGRWGVWIPISIEHPYRDRPPGLNGAGLATILSDDVGKDSRIGWAGPLGCFPAETPRNQQVKKSLIEKCGEIAFFAAVNNENGSHVAPIALAAIEEGENPQAIYPCEGCPKFEEFKLNRKTKKR